MLLFSGWTGHGAVHLLFLAALALFPWRALGGSEGGAAAQPTDDVEDDDT